MKITKIIYKKNTFCFTEIKFRFNSYTQQWLELVQGVYFPMPLTRL